MHISSMIKIKNGKTKITRATEKPKVNEKLPIIKIQ